MVLHSRGCGRVARRRFKRIGPPGRAFGSREVPFFMLFFRASRRASLQEPLFCSLRGLPAGPPGSLEGPFLYPTNLDHAWNHVPAVNPKKSGPAIGMWSGFSFSFRSNAGFPWKERPTKGPRPWESSPAVGAWPYLRFGFPERHDSFGGTLPSVRSLRFCGARTLRPPFPRRRAASARRPMP